MRQLTLAVLLVVAASCGPNIALVSSGMESETELSISTDGLLSNRADVWFPMQEGNTWTLQSASGAVKSVSYQGVYEGIGWLDGLLPDGRWMGQSPSAVNSLYAWDEGTNTWSAFLRFGYAVTPWKFGSGACNTFTVKRTATDAKVVTPAGTFTGARTLTFTMQPSPLARCAAPAFSALTFAPGVGLIALTTVGGANETFLLKSGRVNGKAILAPVGPVAGTLKLDASSYTNQPNTIVCITTPCPGNGVTAVAHVSYTVTNSTAASVTWQFSSGCQFDLALVDATGKTVKLLSETRACTLALTSLTLAPGLSKTYTVEVPLSDRDGNQLKGSYLAKGNLIPRSTGSQVKAAASFSFVVK